MIVIVSVIPEVPIIRFNLSMIFFMQNKLLQQNEEHNKQIFLYGIGIILNRNIMSNHWEILL